MYILVPKHYDCTTISFCKTDGLTPKGILYYLTRFKEVDYWWVYTLRPRAQGNFGAADPVRVHTFLAEKGLTVNLKANGMLIRYVDNPDQTQCLTAVRQNGMALQYIVRPSEELCFEAYKKNKYAVQFIHNPSTMLQYAMVSQNTWCLQFLENPSEELCKMAIKKLPSSIRYLEKPSPALCGIAVNLNGGVLKFIPENLRTEDMLFAALMKSGGVLKYIRNPSEKMITYALTQDGLSLKHVKDPTYAQITLAVRQNGLALQFVQQEKQTPHLCVTACYSNPLAEKYITLFQA